MIGIVAVHHGDDVPGGGAVFVYRIFYKIIGQRVRSAHGVVNGLGGCRIIGGAVLGIELGDVMLLIISGQIYSYGDLGGHFGSAGIGRDLKGMRPVYGKVGSLILIVYIIKLYIIAACSYHVTLAVNFKGSVAGIGAIFTGGSSVGGICRGRENKKTVAVNSHIEVIAGVAGKRAL